MILQANPALLLQINQLKSLPILPETSFRILNAVNNNDIEIEELAKTLGSCAGLVARLLGLANSAYFSQSKPVTDLNTAIFKVLGMDLVKGLSLAIVLNVELNTDQCKAFDSHYFWMRSLLTAHIAQKLANEQKLQQFSSATIYTSGLLLYVGILILAYLMPTELSELFERGKSKELSIRNLIVQELGGSHYHFGHFLLQKWQLPAIYQSVLFSFEDNNYEGETKPLINILLVSQQLSSMLMDTNNFDIAILKQTCEILSIATHGLEKIVDDIFENRENFQKLASIME